jgi:hypothetical protein
LKNPNKKVLYFSDAPKRIMGKLTTKEFLQTWQANHIKPNVAILAFTQQNQEIREIALLSQPQVDTQTDTMTYTACPLPGHKLRSFANLKDINIFFDEFHPWPP